MAFEKNDKIIEDKINNFFKTKEVKTARIYLTNSLESEQEVTDFEEYMITHFEKIRTYMKGREVVELKIPFYHSRRLVLILKVLTKIKNKKYPAYKKAVVHF